MSDGGWFGIDLDGTLAHYDGWRGPTHIGDPIPKMVERVRGFLAQGRQVKVFTARVSTPNPAERAEVQQAILAWTQKHIGVGLVATATKDYAMIVLYDDRAIQIIPNTGMRADGVED